MARFSKLRGKISDQSGISLVAISFMIIAVGIILVLAGRFYTVWKTYQAQTVTDDGLQVIQAALEEYMLEFGHYPCPAPLDATPDTSTFGVAAPDCNGATVTSGTFRSTGRDSRNVRTGAVPVRTLGIPDRFIADGYQHRYVYAVTEVYADPVNPPPSGDNGAIYVRDRNNNPATSTDGNLVQIVYSMAWDNNGAYSLGGNLIQPCDPAAASGENCDFNTNAVFVNTVNKSHNEADPLVTRVSYEPGKIVASCIEESAVPPRHVSFLVDTSGSMGSPVATCPEAIGSPCRRIDIAHWAMRRLIPARINANSRITAPGVSAGTSSLTGFAPNTQVSGVTAEMVENNLGNIVIDDPEAPGYQEPDLEVLSNDLESRLSSMCPGGWTPLGVHIDALAQRLQDGDETQPNKVVVVSDGLSNQGENPVAVAQDLLAQYPHLQIDIIDVTGDNTDAQTVSEMTGGTYYNPEDADEFLEALYNAAGVCGPLDTPPEPDDHIYCN